MVRARVIKSTIIAGVLMAIIIGMIISQGNNITDGTVSSGDLVLGKTGNGIIDIDNNSKLDVKIVATHGGITVGEDGASHQALEDISYMRSIPDMKVSIPGDCEEVRQVIEYAATTPGPMYIRVPRTNLKSVFS